MRCRASSVLRICLLVLLVGWVSPISTASLPADRAPHILLATQVDRCWSRRERIYLAGAVIGGDARQVTVEGGSDPAAVFPVKNGAFDGMINLEKGENIIRLTAGSLSLAIKVYFSEDSTPPNGFQPYSQHDGMMTKDCLACHPATGGVSDFSRVDPTRAGCNSAQCHGKDSAKARYVHRPVAEGFCISCHNPHGSVHKFQLIRDERMLCIGCHGQKDPKLFKQISTAKFPHQPVAEGGCADCHRPHSSDWPSLLAGSIENLCFSCHRSLAEEVAASLFRHGPVRTGDCIACHNQIHGSDHRQLLSHELSIGLYDTYTPASYDLCFTCHNRDIAARRITLEATDFRDGEDNLHFRHVNGKRGRTCSACHDVHASSQSKHIRREVPFGDWSYPIQFTRTGDGGTCVVGCHAPKTYDRVNPRLPIGNRHN